MEMCDIQRVPTEMRLFLMQLEMTEAGVSVTQSKRFLLTIAAGMRGASVMENGCSLSRDCGTVSKTSSLRCARDVFIEMGEQSTE